MSPWVERALARNLPAKDLTVKETDVSTPKTAFVRMRGEEWDISLVAAEELEAEGRIWRDYDCEQNAIDNGFPNEGPAYGVTGDEDSIEETQTARLLDLLVDGVPL